VTSITVELPEEDLARLQAMASSLGRTPEELVVTGIERLLQRSDAELVSGEVRSGAPDNGTNKASRRITELRGLGRELWRDIDAQEYVRRERNAWGG